MNTKHINLIREWAGSMMEKVYLLDPNGINDPLGMPVEEYFKCAQRIEMGIRRYLPMILGEEG